MNNESGARQEPEWAAWVAIDWADEKHAWSLAEAGSSQREQGELQQSPEAVEVWACDLRQRFGGRPIAVAVEQKRGALVYQLVRYPHLVIYPVHPSSAAHFREALYPSGAKDDPADSELLLEILLHHRQHLRALKPDTVPTRLLQGLTEHRRRMVNEKTRYKNRLTAQLKMYYPQMLKWLDVDTVMMWDLLERWPTLAELKRQKPSQLTKFFSEHNCRSEARIQERIQQIYAAMPATDDPAVEETCWQTVLTHVAMLQTAHRRITALDERIGEVLATHPEGALFASFPSAGPALLPRLVAAFGTDRERFQSSSEVQSYSGIAPVTERSGKTIWVHVRRACPHFLRQTFHEYAQHSLAKSVWAKAYYQLLREKGHEHHDAVRAVAYKWIRIMFACWRDNKPYDEAVYLEALKRRNSPLLASLGNVTELGWKKVAGFSKLSANPA